MPLPTMGQVISKIQSYQDGRYAQSTREILEQIEVLSKENVDQFNDYLVNLLHDPTYNKSFKRTIYKTILVLGQLFPRNTIQSGDIIDPITLERIASNDIFISLDRYHWSIRNLIKFFSTKNTYINPLTNLEFSSLDFYHIQKIATQYGLVLRFHTNTDNILNPSRPLEHRVRSLEISSLLCVFFKHPNTPQQGNVIVVPTPFGGACFYTGHK